MPNTDTPPEVLALCAAGLTEHLVPLIPHDGQLSPSSEISPKARGKVPGRRNRRGQWSGFPNWQNYSATIEDVAAWVASGASLGLKTRAFPAIDVDVDNGPAAAAIERALESLLGGDFLRRVRRSGARFAVPCRLPVGVQPFKKSVATLHYRDGAPVGCVEFPGDGEQIVIRGMHPTGVPNEWSDGTRRGGVGLLAERGAGALPELTPEFISEHVIPALERALIPLGILVTRPAPRTARHRGVVDQGELRAPSLDELRSVVAQIRNDDPWDTREARNNMGYAIKAAAGPDHEADGLELWMEWRERKECGMPPDSPDRIAERWQSFKPPFRIGFSWLLYQARAYGYNSAHLDFDADPAALPPSDTRVPAEVPAFQSREERIAALTGDAVAALVPSLDSLGGRDAVGARLAVLQRAADAGTDPLAKIFHGEVLHRVRRARLEPDNRRRFHLFANAELQQVDKWKELAPPDRELLLDAARAAVADYATLAGARATTAGQQISSEAAATESFVIDSWLARGEVGALIGKPSQGKTYVANWLAVNVGAPPNTDEMGLPIRRLFAEREVEHGAVLYFAGEDPLNARRRIDAMAAGIGAATPVVRVFGRVPPLDDAAAAIGVVLDALGQSEAAGDPPPALLVIDTVRTAWTGDENGPLFGAVPVLARLLGKLTNAAVLLVHHMGKDEKRGASGHLSFTAGCYWVGSMLERSKNEDPFQLFLQKHRNGPGLVVAARWSLRGGLLVPEAGPAATAEHTKTARRVQVVGRTLWDITRTAPDVPAGALWAKCQAAAPELFPDRERAAFDDARRGAVEAGYIRSANARGRGPWRRGSVDPGPTVGDLLKGA